MQNDRSPEARRNHMSEDWKETARACLEGAETGTMTFPQIVGTLINAGFDGYAVDLRGGVTTYYLTSGKAVALAAPLTPTPVAERFDADAVRAAIREAQALVPGYTYKGFCAKVAAAGCAGYLVSFPGKRVLYFGRTGETHTEYFPNAKP
jgi:uncharacterized protein YbcV (DUF1398 family)